MKFSKQIENVQTSPFLFYHISNFHNLYFLFFHFLYILYNLFILYTGSIHFASRRVDISSLRGVAVAASTAACAVVVVVGDVATVSEPRRRWPQRRWPKMAPSRPHESRRTSTSYHNPVGSHPTVS